MKQFTGYAMENGFRFKYWAKGTHRRIYVANYSGHNTRNTGGWIDLNGNIIHATGSVAGACRDFLNSYEICIPAAD